MPDLSVLLVFAAACAALAATPGPDMLLIASRSVSQGRAAGFLTWAGIGVGTYCHAIAAALGLSQLVLLVPVVYEILRWLGAAYLLYLAWRAWRTPGDSFSPTAGLQRRSMGRIFGEGLATNLLNPKMALFVLAFFPQFVDPGAGALLPQMLILASLLNGVGFVINGAVVLLGSQLRGRRVLPARWRKLPQYLMAGVFAGLACRLALEGQK